ncbi:hypothetical protein Pmar_PMAR015525 [Perkinsus marinus ATCC 50983]|uniref:Uncharacterized protein n=1 Tax=Perkinsus marinus (strain ATCC 50983 / TXsc) TaxID=423536 RepID=C5LNA4_PERM5|nr:hypothetical protein Pmar_PMAR015525 [Perkinsus marinus ATCC 50983]EER01783.1 hypothetical protein Pmar_PMAR015525 [Perkinsus marinus ATCC 50983]|eukprot:XP_002769065.1 hypothetical protein Pmar_PMAR015525 [Perkinsus marinus ATCC 50983]
MAPETIGRRPGVQCVSFSGTSPITIHNGAVSIDLAGGGALAVVRVHIDQLPLQIKYIAVLCRRSPDGHPLSEAAKSMNYYVGYEGVGEEEPLVTVEEVPFSESDVDWFVIGVLIVDRDAAGQVMAVYARNVCSFPQEMGEVDTQLQGLIEDTSDEVGQNAHGSHYGVPGMELPFLMEGGLSDIVQ